MKFIYTQLEWLLKLSMIMMSVDALAVIPTSHIKGIDELFREQFKAYSPINGLIHSTKSIPYLYKTHPDPNSPFFQILNSLFVIIPGGEITFSHLARNPASHLSGSAIAQIFYEVEKAKKLDLRDINLEHHLFEKFLDIIKNDSKYLESLAQAEINIQNAKEDYENFLDCFKNQSELTQKINHLESTELIPLNRAITKLRKNKLKLSDEEQLSLQNLEQKRTLAENQIRELKRNIITNDQMKKAEKKYHYKLQINDVKSESYKINLETFIFNLVKSFMNFELNESLTQEPHHPTTYTLLSYIWMKYDQKLDLQSYLVTLIERHFLKDVEWKSVYDVYGDFYNDFYSKEELQNYQKNFKSSWFKKKWVQEHVPQSLALISDVPKSTKYPEIVSFSYFKWITYSIFPDCCENTLHNFFNLIAFNPATGYFDAHQLKQLKQNHYPNLSSQLINFYEKYPNPSDHQSTRASSDWMKIVSNLNEGIQTLPENCQVHYRNSCSHVASPYTNILKVIHRLMGFVDLTGDHLSEIFENLRKISGQEIHYDRSKIDDQGFGEAIFEIGEDRFQINSYRPVHMSFHQSKKRLDPTYEKLVHFVNLELNKLNYLMLPKGAEAF